MTIITATATKESESSKLGVAFTRAGIESPLVVKLVREDSLFAGSDLKAGMIVGSVQGEPMTWKTPKEAADLLRAAPAGPVTVTSEAFVAEITKSEDPAVKLGISLKNSTKSPGIFISKITEEGAFAGSELKAGQKVLLINGEPCPPSVKDAITLVKAAKGSLKIITIPVDLTPPTDTAEEPAEEPVPVAAPVVEEKKEEAPEETTRELETEGEEKPDMDVVDPEPMPEEDKGIIDKMFATCIC